MLLRIVSGQYPFGGIMAKAKKIIRNLHSVPLNLRFGSKKDPYYLQLARRGQNGDVIEVPGEIADHISFSQNVGKSFEIISAAEAKKIEYDTPVTQTLMNGGEFVGPLGETLRAGTVVNLEDNAQPVGGFDEKGNLVRLKDVGPRRSTAVGTQDNPVPEEHTPPVEPPMPKFVGVERATGALEEPVATKTRAKTK